MLRGIPNCLSPDLLKVLAEMGHGDTLVIGDVLSLRLQRPPQYAGES